MTTLSDLNKYYRTTNATATAADIATSKIAYINGGRVVGGGTDPTPESGELSVYRSCRDADAIAADISVGKTAYTSLGSIIGTLAPVAVTSVEIITPSFSTTETTKTTNLSKGQDYTQCVPFVSYRRNTQGTASANNFEWVRATMIDNAGTPAVKLDRGVHGSLQFNFVVAVVEFNSNVSVQQIPWTVTAPTASSTPACTAVDLSKAFLVNTYMVTSGTGTGLDDGCVRTSFNSTTQINCYRNTASGFTESLSGVVYVVEDKSAGNNYFSVQSFSGNNATAGNYDSTISSVTPASSTLIYTTANTPAGSTRTDLVITGELLNATTARITLPQTSSYQRYWAGFVVTWNDGTTVQRGTKSVTSTTTTSVQTESTAITPVDTTRSIAISTMQMSINTAANQNHTFIVTEDVYAISVRSGGAYIDMAHYSSYTALPTIIKWEVIEFAT